PPPQGAPRVLYRSHAAGGRIVALELRGDPQLPGLEAGASGRGRAARIARDARDRDRLADRHGRRGSRDAVSAHPLVARSHQDDRPGAGPHAVLVLRAPARLLLAPARVRGVVHDPPEGGGREAVQRLAGALAVEGSAVFERGAVDAVVRGRRHWRRDQRRLRDECRGPQHGLDPGPLPFDRGERRSLDVHGYGLLAVAPAYGT